jgi:hypothetical protein
MREVSVRLVIYVLTVWFLVSIPVALFLGRLCRICEDSFEAQVLGSDIRTDVAAIRARRLAHAEITVGSTTHNTWDGGKSAVNA